MCTMPMTPISNERILSHCPFLFFNDILVKHKPSVITLNAKDR